MRSPRGATRSPVEQLVCNPDGPTVAADTAIGEDPGNDADAGAEEDRHADEQHEEVVTGAA
jgi:hypothetical protein